MKRTMRKHIILRVVSKVLIPFIFLFALYVQFHGDYGPGGGFQAGVIFASAIILYTLVFGLRCGRDAFDPRWMEKFAALGVLIFGGVGVWSILHHGNFLDYNVLNHHDPKHGQHIGMLIVELGVGITVTSAMVCIFFAFTSRGRRA